MIPAREIFVDGELWTAWTRVEVERRGALVAITVEPESANTPIPLGSELHVRLGRVTSSGPELVDVARGRVAGFGRTRRWSADTLELVVDATERRLAIAPDELLRFEGKSIEEILFTVYVETLGFADVATNLRPFIVEEFEIPTTAAYHAAVQSLISGLSPKTFVDPITNTFCIWDTRFPLPAGLPVRDLAFGATSSYSIDTPPPEIINVVRLQTWADDVARETGYHPFRDRVRRPAGEKQPNGFPRARTLETIREYFEDPQNAARITHSALKRRRQEVYSPSGELVSVVETTYGYLPGTYDRLLETETVKKWTRVRVASGAFELVLTRQERKHKNWRYDPATKTHVELGEWSETEGEVLVPDNIPLEAGSREGISGKGGRQYSEWRRIEHGHVSVAQIGPVVSRITTVWDDLNEGVTTQEDESYVGETEAVAAREEASELVLDEVSIGLWGRSPEISWDGRVYGRELGIELIRAHLFSGHGAAEPRTSLDLFDADPTWYDGSLVRFTEKDSTTALYLVTAVVDLDDAPAQTTATKLILVPVEEDTL